jgi:hypothetical protein
MSIGRVGKRAQHMSQQQRERYQVNAIPDAPDFGPVLLPPRHPTVQRTPEPVILDQRFNTSVQRAVEVSEVQAEAPAESPSDSAPQAGQSGGISAKEVAEQVWAMLRRDAKLERERLGKRRY